METLRAAHLVQTVGDSHPTSDPCKNIITYNNVIGLLRILPVLPSDHPVTSLVFAVDCKTRIGLSTSQLADLSCFAFSRYSSSILVPLFDTYNSDVVVLVHVIFMFYIFYSMTAEIDPTSFTFTKTCVSPGELLVRRRRVSKCLCTNLDRVSVKSSLGDGPASTGSCGASINIRFPQAGCLCDNRLNSRRIHETVDHPCLGCTATVHTSNPW